jgi:hypothetical protein
LIEFGSDKHFLSEIDVFFRKKYKIEFFEGSGFGIAETNKLCLNGNIYFFRGSLSIIYDQHIKKSR